jgi:hypothetical protein
MKTVALNICLFFFLLYPLSAHDDFYFEEYDDLRPDINTFAGGSIEGSNNVRQLLFRTLSSWFDPILIGNTGSNVLSVLPDEQIGMERRQMISQYFWDPHTRNNYQYCQGVSLTNNEERGWYLLKLSNNYLALHLQDNYRYWADNTPPHVQLTDTKFFTAQYQLGQFSNHEEFLTSYRSSFKIIDTKLNQIVWEMTKAADRFTNLYWITEQWHLILRSTYFAMRPAEPQNTIFNYETGETVSFAPEIIIGYGKEVVLTTTETENGFIGITVWTPEKEVLYRDRNFSLSGIIDHEHGQITWGRPCLFISYFDFPYIYCNIGRIGPSNSYPYATLIMNLTDGKTYYSPLGYHLFGIFGSE